MDPRLANTNTDNTTSLKRDQVELGAVSGFLVMLFAATLKLNLATVAKSASSSDSKHIGLSQWGAGRRWWWWK